MEKKRFLFYTSWKKNIDMMDDVELRRFINNLIDHTEGREINLPTRLEKMVWNDVVEVLELNERKRVEVVQKRREAGKKGGAPVGNNNAQKKTDVVNKTTKNNQMVEKQTKQPEERSMLSVVCKEKDVVCSKKEDVSSMLNVIKQEWNILLNKKLTSGWNSLSIKECARYYELEEQLKIK